jgi:uncharacterized protein
MRLNRVGATAAATLLVCSGIAGAAVRDLPLVDAIKNGDLAAIRTVLPKADVNAAEVDGSTAVHWAAYREQLEALDLLIAAGGNVKVANRYGVTPLSLASIKGNAAIVERLLRAGADPNVPLPGGETPLMTAARAGKADALRVLLAHGAHVNAREETRGQTALMWAAAEGNAAAIEALIEGGADPNLRANGPAEREDSNAGLVKRTDQLTPLLFAARRGHIIAVRALLKGGANINDLAPDGSGVVNLAIANAHYELASILLDEGADPTAATNGWTALHQLMRTRRPSLDRIAPPVGYDDDFALTLAQKLVAHGADVNARMVKDVNDGYRRNERRVGATPFFLAAKGVDARMMRVLLANGADPRMATEDGTTPLLVAAGFGESAPHESGTDQDARAAVKVCLEATGGDDLNVANKEGWTALHGAAYRGDNEMVQMLVNRGARLDAKIKQGFTPLGIANGWAGAGDSGVGGDVHYQPETIVLLRRLMIERGLSPDGPENLGRKVLLQP